MSLIIPTLALVLALAPNLGALESCSFTDQIRDPSNCRQYRICDSGVIIEKACPQGKFFSQSLLNCLPVPSSDCRLDSKAPDLNGKPCRKEGERIPGLVSCDSYYNCNNGLYREEICPRFETFSPELKTCVKDDYAQACRWSAGADETQNYILNRTSPYAGICTGAGTSQVSLPDPFQCHLYVRCVRTNGSTVLLIGECEPGTLFDPGSGRCQNPGTVHCGERYRDIAIYGEELVQKHGRVKRGRHDAVRNRRVKPTLKPQPGRYIAPIEISARKPIYPQATNSNSKTLAGRGGRGLGASSNGADGPQLGNVSDYLEANQQNLILQPTGSPEFSLKYLFQNALKNKRKLKTRTRETETEYFGQNWNLTNASMNIRPKMKVRVTETEAFYEDGDESSENGTKLNATTISPDVEKQIRCLLAGTPCPEGSKGKTGRNIIGLAKPSPLKELKRRRKLYKQRPPSNEIQPRPINYEDYEAPTDTDYELSTQATDDVPEDIKY